MKTDTFNGALYGVVGANGEALKKAQEKCFARWDSKRCIASERWLNYTEINAQKNKLTKDKTNVSACLCFTCLDLDFAESFVRHLG